MLGDRFVQGCARFSDRSPVLTEPTAKIYVKVSFKNLVEGHLAQVDTGAAWSVLSPRIARDLGLMGRIGDRVRLSTRFGIQEGHLVRIPFTLVAEEGESLDTEGTFFISRDWPFDLTFLGYSGMLDSIRFALDPQANRFYFGGS
jgi:hypothetical protein